MAQDGSIEIGIVVDDSELQSTLETMGETASAALDGLTMAAPETLFAQVLDQLSMLSQQTYMAGVEAGAQFAMGLSVGGAQASTAAISLAAGVCSALKTGVPGASAAGLAVSTGFASGITTGTADATAATVLLIASASASLMGAGKPAFQAAGLMLGASLANGITLSAPQSVVAASAVCQSAVRSAQSYQGQLVSVGVQLVNGMVAGIRSMAGSAASALGAVVTQAIAHAKSVAGIHSPSRVMRDEVGHMMGLGLALGITRSREEVGGAMHALSAFAIENARQDGKSYQEIGALYTQNLLYGLQEGMKAGEVEFTSYVERLFDTYRDENGRLEGANKEAAELIIKQYKDAVTLGYDDAVAYIKTRVGELAAVYQEQYDTLIQEQERLSKRLMTGSDLFSFGKDGMAVENLDASIASIERYGEAIEALKARGASNVLLGEIGSLSMEQGIEAAEYLLSLTDEAFVSLDEKWTEKRALARDVAAAFYEDQLKALDENFNAELAQALADMPEALTHIGADTMQGFVDGMISKTGAVNDAVRAIAQQMIATMRESLDIHSPSRKTAKLIGEPAAQGIGAGFISAMDGVYQTMRSAVDYGVTQLSAQSVVRTPEARGAMTSSHLIERETSETVSKISVDDASLSGFGRELMKLITIEQQRVGKHIVKGGAPC